MNIHELLELLSEHGKIPNSTSGKAGAIDAEGSLAEKIADYEEEMQFLHAAGADYSGQGAWRGFMQRLGRSGQGEVHNAIRHNLYSQERSGE